MDINNLLNYYINENLLKSNNKFRQLCNMPALMSDGRLFTNYNSNSFFEEGLKNILINDSDSYKYRIALQNNAENIINNTIFHYNKYRCYEDNKINTSKFYIDHS